jgi:hypothetical protein
MPAVSVICGCFVSIVQNEGDHSCRPTLPVALSMYLGVSLNSGLCFRFLFCSEVRSGSGYGGREWLEGVGYFLMSMLTIAALHQILGRSNWREWNDWDVWRLLERREHGFLTLVCEMKMWKRDACLWAENVDVWPLVRWKRGCVTLVCELRMWICDR